MTAHHVKQLGERFFQSLSQTRLQSDSVSIRVAGKPERRGCAGWRTRALAKCSSALLAILLSVIVSGQVHAEVVSVKYGGEIDLAPFHCTDISKGRRISRVCYDLANKYLLIRVEQSYQQFCEVDC